MIQVVYKLVFICLLIISIDCQSQALKALVVLVDFSDSESIISQQAYSDFFNNPQYADINSPISINEFIAENSGGKLHIDAMVEDWISLPHDIAHYVTLDNNTLNKGPQAMFEDALDILLQQGFDFSPFDNNGDGELELVGIIHRGSNAVYGTGIAPDWSTVPVFQPALHVGEYTLRRGWMITDSNPAFGTITTIGGIAHEMLGHAICHVPDLNSWNPGSWAYMYGGSAFTPTHFSAYTKHQCGWVNTLDIEKNGEQIIAPINEAHKVYRLWIDPFRDGEYFLLEYRNNDGLDQALPGQGLLIWHVDEFADQTEFLRLEQADGRDDLANTSNFGYPDDSDPFPGSSENVNFSDNSLPNSRSRNGQLTGIAVENISLTNNGVSALITSSEQLQGITLKHDESYPQFNWNWEPEGNITRQGEHFAVRFTSPVNGDLSRIKMSVWGAPPDDAISYSLNIHEDFDDSVQLNTESLYHQEGILGTDLGWYLIELANVVPITQGQVFVVDMVLNYEFITIDYSGDKDGHSFYLQPESDSYVPMDFDIRLRAQITTTDPAIEGEDIFQNSRLMISRLRHSDYLTDLRDVHYAVHGNQVTLESATPDQYAVAHTDTTLEGNLLIIPRLKVFWTETDVKYFSDVQIRFNDDGTYTLLNLRAE